MKMRNALWFVLWIGLAAPAQNSCLNPDVSPSRICINSIQAGFLLGGTNGEETKITLNIHFLDTNTASGTEPDFFQVRFSQTAAGGMQFIRQDKTWKGWEGIWKTTQPYIPGTVGPPYLIQVQRCYKLVLSPASCLPWANVTYTPPPPGYVAPPTRQMHAAPSGAAPSNSPALSPNGTPRAQPGNAANPTVNCKPGFVWRQANAQDHVCVTPQMRTQIMADNKMSPLHTAANGMCVRGYVWRQANAQDHVCVVPQTHTATAADNAASPSRTN